MSKGERDQKQDDGYKEERIVVGCEDVSGEEI
jgi:hypothetical protein